ncbi:MAG: hypothetical protein IPK65_00410 [Gammaproteobacteria bacterium]|nr:hypothetical protein [Gammaproteobacteria bacterium]
MFRSIMESTGMMEPEREQVVAGANPGEYNLMRMLRAMRGADGHYAFIYFPGSDLSADINVGEMSGSTITAWWYNPRDGHTYTDQGDRQSTAKPFMTISSRTTTWLFDPPGDGGEQDWVLVLDDDSMKYPPPGLAYR